MLKEDVRVGDIFVDDTYGRPLRGKLKKMIAGWDRREVGVIYLSLRADGRYACLDGWHRVTACRTVEGENSTLPARVYIDLSVAEEADLFNAFNRDRQALSAGDLFKSRLAANEKKAHDIYRIIRDIGLDISFDGRPGEGLIQGVATVDHIYDRYGGDMLREVYLTMTGALGTHSADLTADVAKGLAAFLARYGDKAERKRLHDILAVNGHRLRMHANGIKVESPGLNLSTAVGMALLRLYNEKLRKGHLAMWSTFAPQKKAA